MMNKTQFTDTSVADFIAAIDHPVRRADAQTLDTLFRKATGWQPRMFGPTIIGYGSYHYVYDSGREGDCQATGFSPRKANLVLYIMPGYQDFGHILERLGKYKLGKACLYINKLADVDLDVVEEIIKAGVADLSTRWPVTPT
ncbi:protein of unknown function (DU1801) [Cognatiyoonia koreensis]|uniref:YdhG-like domain-containing protein n=1 Tax=Cognatiyoonia koreensis TaxID=364200 RepID=A0A1I0MUD4_9RHOB|nr:DUF1801 domain-containing protein [Cognatiyoonia koreensis]SEV91926.1 protein of unknown function (DU1801) [Cognatiyoonia koreensis]